MTPAAFDITLAVIMLLSIGIAFWRGLIREVFTILGLIASVIGGWKGGPLLIPQFNKWLNVPKDGGVEAAEAVSRGAATTATGSEIVEAAAHKSTLIFGVVSPELAAKLCAYGTAFAAVFFIMALIGYVLSRGVEEMGLGLVDRLGGAAFGAVRGFLFIFLPYVLAAVLLGEERFPDWARNSASIPLLQRAYAAADTHLGLAEIVKDRGNEIVLKLDKIDPKKLALSPDEAELKENLSREEQEETP
jgi:uncharacterized membrane protein required for colicin V production